MAPQRWANAEQLDFLKKRVTDFRGCQATHTVNKFWPVMLKEWGLEFPERLALFGPDHDLERQLSGDESKSLGKARAKRQQRLKNWYNNLRANDGRQADRAADLSILHCKSPSGSRTLQSAELYSKKYYAKRVQPLVEEKIREMDHSPSKGELLVLRNKITCEALQRESDEIKSEIELERIGTKAAMSMDLTEPRPLEFQRAIDNVPRAVKMILERLSEQTGWSWSIVGGGPMPSQGGTITTSAFHVGKNESGNIFPEVCARYQEHWLTEYWTFLKSVYLI